MTKTPRNYPETMPSAESGRPMTRGEKLVSFKVEGRTFTYRQPGWWCSLTDPVLSARGPAVAAACLVPVSEWRP